MLRVREAALDIASGLREASAVVATPDPGIASDESLRGIVTAASMAANQLGVALVVEIVGDGTFGIARLRPTKDTT
jgi:protein-L-isoaspartate O-methyltransferase